MKVPRSAPVSDAALQSWLHDELDGIGVDSSVYTHYILSILQQEPEIEENDFFSEKAKKDSKRIRCEDLRRAAAVECLLSASERKIGVEKLVDDLCARLNELHRHNDNGDGGRSTDESGAETDYTSSTPEEQAERYYAAFPALSTEAVIGTAVDHKVWKKNKSKEFVVPKLPQTGSSKVPSNISTGGSSPFKLPQKVDDTTGIQIDTAYKLVSNTAIKALWDSEGGDKQLQFSEESWNTAWRDKEKEEKQRRSEEPKPKKIPKLKNTAVGEGRKRSPPVENTMEAQLQSLWKSVDKTDSDSPILYDPWQKSCSDYNTSFPDIDFNSILDDICNTKFDICKPEQVNPNIWKAEIDSLQVGVEENLLISPRTHFKPIRQESHEETYEDGTTFSTINDHPCPEFVRSTSGVYYLDTDRVQHDSSPPKYLSFKHHNTNDLDANVELDLKQLEVQARLDYESRLLKVVDGVGESLVPKFRVASSELEKFCQTDHPYYSSLASELPEFQRCTPSPLYDRLSVGSNERIRFASGQSWVSNQSSTDSFPAMNQWSTIANSVSPLNWMQPAFDLCTWSTGEDRVVDRPTDEGVGPSEFTRERWSSGKSVQCQLREEIEQEEEELFNDIHLYRNIDLAAEEHISQSLPSTWIPEDLPEMPSLPVDAAYSQELEDSWQLTENEVNVAPIPRRIKRTTPIPPSQKPCSFFMEGHCRRVECKFSHDLSTITCRFWEESSCFKGDTCPFLHGYAEIGTEKVVESSSEQREFEMTENEFPVLPGRGRKISSVKDATETGSRRKKARFPRHILNVRHGRPFRRQIRGRRESE